MSLPQLPMRLRAAAQSGLFSGRRDLLTPDL